MAESEATAGQIEVRAIPAGDTWPLRLAVLRPGRPAESAKFPGDDLASTRHFGAYRDGRLQGIASLYLAAMPEKPNCPAFQLRGMATAADARGLGLGRALVHSCMAFAREQQASLLWCNARVSAVEFYRRFGFEIWGGEFEIPDVGPHFRMFWQNKRQPSG